MTDPAGTGATPLPPRPRRPDDEECCGRGCDPCIFDYYERALLRWEEKMRALGADPRQMGERPGG